MDNPASEQNKNPRATLNDEVKLYHSYKNDRLILDQYMPEVPVSLYAVIVNKIHQDVNVAIATDGRPERCTLTSAVSI